MEKEPEDNIKETPQPEPPKEKPRVYYFGVLCPERVLTIDCANSILNAKTALEAQGHQVRWCLTNVAKGADNSKNLLISSFLGSDATHFIFWDSSYSCTTPEFLKLIEADKPFISAPANSKNYHWGNLAEFVKKGGSLQLGKIAPLITDYNINMRGVDPEPSAEGILAVSSAELPIYVCTREFLMMLARAHKNCKYEDPTYGAQINTGLYAFFESKITYRGGDSAFVSGDDSFCDKIRTIGEKILIHTQVRCEAISKIPVMSFLGESLKVAQEVQQKKD